MVTAWAEAQRTTEVIIVLLPSGVGAEDLVSNKGGLHLGSVSGCGLTDESGCRWGLLVPA